MVNPWYISGPIICLVLLIILLYIYMKVSMGRFNSKERMDGKTVIITGANAGIGYECALDLAGRGARVIMACRSQSKADTARDRIISATGSKNVHVRLVDMLSFASVRKFASEILATEQRIDVLMNNAGAGGLGDDKTVDGLLPGIQCNHYSPFLLTCLLLDRIKKSGPSRVIFVASVAHWIARFDVNDINQDNWNKQSDSLTYSNSKLLTILTSNELARRTKNTDVTCNSLCPGPVATEFFNNQPSLVKFLFRIFFKTPVQGAQTQLKLAVDPQLINASGKYYSDCQEAIRSAKAKDPILAKKVWEYSENIVQLKDSEKYYQ